MADENKVEFFAGGNNDQRRHLNKLVNMANQHEDWRDAVEGIKPDAPLQAVVLAPDGKSFNLVEIARANHIADYTGNAIAGGLLDRAQPWEPRITSIKSNSNGEAVSVTIDFNPYSTLWKAEQWGENGKNWDEDATISGFGPKVLTSSSQIVYLQCDIDPFYQSIANSLTSGGPWSGWPSNGSKGLTGGSMFLKHLLAYFRPALEDERADVVFQGGERCVLVGTTNTHLRVAIIRGEYSGSGYGVADFGAIVPWFGTYRLTNPA